MKQKASLNLRSPVSAAAYVLLMLDGIGFFEDYLNDNPDELLGFSDWMKIPIEPVPVTLDRLKRLLAAEVAASTDMISGGN